MMVYFDTSFIAPLVIAEATSDAVEAVVVKLKPVELTTSLWAQVELASLVSRKVRMGELSGSEGDAVRRECERMFGESFAMLAALHLRFAASIAFQKSAMVRATAMWAWGLLPS